MKNAFLCVFSDPKKLNRTCGVSLLKHGMNETNGLHGKENPPPCHPSMPSGIRFIAPPPVLP